MLYDATAPAKVFASSFGVLELEKGRLARIAARRRTWTRQIAVRSPPARHPSSSAPPTRHTPPPPRARCPLALLARRSVTGLAALASRCASIAGTHESARRGALHTRKSGAAAALREESFRGERRRRRRRARDAGCVEHVWAIAYGRLWSIILSYGLKIATTTAYASTGFRRYPKPKVQPRSAGRSSWRILRSSPSRRSEMAAWSPRPHSPASLRVRATCNLMAICSSSMRRAPSQRTATFNNGCGSSQVGIDGWRTSRRIHWCYRAASQSPLLR